MADAKEVWVGFMKNGSVDKYVALANSSFTNARCGGGGVQRFYLDGVDDYVQLIVYHNHGSSRSLYLGTSNSSVHWGGHKISDDDICGL
jgi:hypothetical protein